MVSNVIGRNVVEEMGSDDTEIAIDRCCCAVNESPLFCRVFWDCRVSVVEVGDHYDLCLVLALIPYALEELMSVPNC